jgi:hypothetical protein
MRRQKKAMRKAQSKAGMLTARRCIGGAVHRCAAGGRRRERQFSRVLAPVPAPGMGAGLRGALFFASAMVAEHISSM